MILKASIFRISNFAYKSATKRKLNLFINTIIFLSIFAVSAAILSLYFENKIDEIDRKVILTDIQKISLENQISTVVNSLNSISLIKDAQLHEQSTIDILSDVNPGGQFSDPIVTLRDRGFEDYYDIITLIDISVIENKYYIDLNKSIFMGDPEVLNEINKFEEINNKNLIDLNSVASKARKTEDDWEAYEKKNLISKYGKIGIFIDVLPEGVLVNKIAKNEPASKSDLKEGDIILSVNGNKFENLSHESDVNFKIKPDIPAKFKVKSNGVIKDIIIIPEKAFNNEIMNLKDKNYYLKFNEYFEIAKKILLEQENVLLDFGLKFSKKNLEQLNKKVNRLNQELEKISEKEAKAILFAFVIQLIIFFSSQYFEFSLGQLNEKKNRKK